MMYIEAIGGLFILLLGGDFLVRGAVSLARRLGISPLVIGLTVVACGTSAPELVVSLDAALSGTPSIAIGNVIGSNIANFLLVLGVPALVAPVVRETGIVRSYFFMLGASIVFVAFCWSHTLEFWHGISLLILFFAFLFLSYSWGRSSGDKTAHVGSEVKEISIVPGTLRSALGITVIGLIALAFGAHLLVEGASSIARAAGVSEAVIGVTLVAIGTSLPELVTTIMAALHRHGDVVIGNVIGSNLFNILGVMGVTASVIAIPVPIQFLQFDVWVMLIASFALLPFMIRQVRIGRVVGLIFILTYSTYIMSQFVGISGLGY